MMDLNKRLLKLVITPSLLLALPVLGLLISGNNLDPYLRVPPLTGHVDHAPFSWAMFIFVAFFDLLLIGVIIIPNFQSLHDKQPHYLQHPVRHSFPWWGWLSLGALGMFWTLAWTRVSWFSAFQAFTFTPLWLSFILLINAHTYHRTRRCLLLNHPGYFLLLFLASAVFWWYFEYLNRFVDNWRYIGAESFSSASYAFHSTLAFSTVLPAVFSVVTWLQSFPRLQTLRVSVAWSFPHSRSLAGGTLFVASCGLMGLALWPQYLFPCLWISPLLAMISIQVLLKEPTVFSNLGCEGWQRIFLCALAAVICGFFWEMWNYYSMAKWVYAIPFVNRFHIFEMPILGYGGYLPFGVACLVVVDFFVRPWNPNQRPLDWVFDENRPQN